MNYFLIGLPGSGKTSIGKDLRQLLSLELVDLDHVIEETAEMEIKDIFAQKGETYFRELEKDCLQKVVQGDNQLISTGGGTPCFFDNMDVIKSNGVSIYLNVPVDEIADRMLSKQEGIENRPLVKSSSKNDLVKELAEKLKIRSAFYTSADIVIEGANITAEQVAEKIKQKS